MTGHTGDGVWRCHRCQRLNTQNVNFSCWHCRANAPIPPAVPFTNSAPAPTLTEAEKKGQKVLLELVREMK